MQCWQPADIALNAPAIKRGFLLPKLGFPRARTDPEIPINLQCLGILNFRLPRFFARCFPIIRPVVSVTPVIFAK